jgi:hypothetical protein
MMRRGPALSETPEMDEAGAGVDEEFTPASVPVPAAPPRRAPARGQPEPFQTEFSFTLPRGYVDPSGHVHREGSMRLATARDELLPTYDEQVKRMPAYLTVVLLSRVITRLGDLDGDKVTTSVIEGLFAADLAFLQDIYRRINSEGTTQAVLECPSCKEQISVDLAGGRLGE